METAISQEVYEQVRAQIMDEIQSGKESAAGTRAVFSGAKEYIPQLENKYGSGYDERYKCVSHNVYLLFEAVKKAALSAYKCKSARMAYAEGYAEEANELAERILEALLQ